MSSVSMVSSGAAHAPAYINPVHYASMADPSQHVIASEPNYTVPALPYEYDALEPHISAEIMMLHHDKHHAAYVTNLNAALTVQRRQQQPSSSSSSDDGDLTKLQSKIRFNAGGHINHSRFWRNLAAADSRDASAPQEVAPGLLAEIEKTWGSVEEMEVEFAVLLAGIQGSGWGWLTMSSGDHRGTDQKDGEKKRQLSLVAKSNQEPVLAPDVPIIGVDMWEHAYYLQYKTAKQSYIDSVWKIINWTEAEARFEGRAEEEPEIIRIAASMSEA